MNASPFFQDDVIESLLATGKVTPEAVERATRQAESAGNAHSMGYYLCQLEAISARDFLEALTVHFKMTGVDLGQTRIDDDILALLPVEFMQQERVLPVAIDRETRVLTIAMTDPTDLAKVQAVQFATRMTIKPMIADEFTLEAELATRFAQHTNYQELVETLDTASDLAIVETSEAAADAAIQEEVDQTPVVKFINATIQDAVGKRASDIHFEFYATEARVRFRIDGALVPVTNPNRRWERTLAARLKIMAHLDPTLRTAPQDGRIKVKVQGRPIDLRVSTMPTNFGEKIVLRILDKSAVSLDLQALGVDDVDQRTLIEAIAKPHGLVLATGPTGAGKTTTLYALLALLNRPEVNIMTVEDPVEYDLPGVNQVAVNPDRGLTFAAALRGFLRQDPDVVMVGEMRDAETAEIGLRAALTGHLVLSTMHTNSAAEAVTRMLDLQLEKFNIATATSMIVAQRLLRRVCSACAVPYTPDVGVIRASGLADADVAQMTFRRGEGCRACSGTGYRGRLGVYEILRMSPEIADLILRSATTREIQAVAMREGMRTLRLAALARVHTGETTLEEVIRHTVF